MAATKKGIQSMLDELSTVEGKIEKNQAKFTKDTAAALKAYDEAVAGPQARLADANRPLEEQRVALRKQIEAAMLEKRDAAGDPAFRKVESETGYAAEATVSEKREVEPEGFFKKYGKKAGFWGAVTVAIAKAEKLIGKNELDLIATKARSWKVEIRKG